MSESAGCSDLLIINYFFYNDMKNGKGWSFMLPLFCLNGVLTLQLKRMFEDLQVVYTFFVTKMWSKFSAVIYWQNFSRCRQMILNKWSIIGGLTQIDESPCFVRLTSYIIPMLWNKWLVEFFNYVIYIRCLCGTTKKPFSWLLV